MHMRTALRMTGALTGFKGTKVFVILISVIIISSCGDDSVP